MIDPIVVQHCQVLLSTCRKTAGQMVGMYVQRQRTKRDIVRALLLVWCFLMSSALRASDELERGHAVSPSASTVAGLR